MMIVQPFPQNVSHFLSALSLLTIRAGGTLVIERVSELDRTSGDLIIDYDKEKDRLTVTHRMRPGRVKFPHPKYGKVYRPQLLYLGGEFVFTHRAFYTASLALQYAEKVIIRWRRLYTAAVAQQKEATDGQENEEV